MSEEEIVKCIKDEIRHNKEMGDFLRNGGTKDIYYKTVEALQGILDLYNKEKQKNKNLLLQLKDSEKELLEVTKNIISKDKIKEKMQEIMNYTYSSAEERHNQNYAYDRLKELLGETNEKL